MKFKITDEGQKARRRYFFDITVGFLQSVILGGLIPYNVRFGLTGAAFDI
ncbi:MAG: hypothetical protein PUB34_03875 [Clostridia bacterium]|nr:hypothetical protein [Clostridia bacterium]